MSDQLSSLHSLVNAQNVRISELQAQSKGTVTPSVMPSPKEPLSHFSTAHLKNDSSHALLKPNPSGVTIVDNSFSHSSILVANTNSITPEGTPLLDDRTLQNGLNSASSVSIVIPKPQI